MLREHTWLHHAKDSYCSRLRNSAHLKAGRAFLMKQLKTRVADEKDSRFYKPALPERKAEILPEKVTGNSEERTAEEDGLLPPGSHDSATNSALGSEARSTLY